jgi:hypothetical protein
MKQGNVEQKQGGNTLEMIGQVHREKTGRLNRLISSRGVVVEIRNKINGFRN